MLPLRVTASSSDRDRTLTAHRDDARRPWWPSDLVHGGRGGALNVSSWYYVSVVAKAHAERLSAMSYSFLIFLALVISEMINNVPPSNIHTSNCSVVLSCSAFKWNRKDNFWSQEYLLLSLSVRAMNVNRINYGAAVESIHFAPWRLGPRTALTRPASRNKR